jgi:hypothetical protein
VVITQETGVKRVRKSRCKAECEPDRSILMYARTGSAGEFIGKAEEEGIVLL